MNFNITNYLDIKEYSNIIRQIFRSIEDRKNRNRKILKKNIENLWVGFSFHEYL